MPAARVAHFDLEKSARADTVADALNAHLRPEPIAVLDAAAVGSSFDARLSARERAYLYRIVNRRAPLTTERGRAWLVQTPLDAGRDGRGGRAARGQARFLGPSGRAFARRARR